MYETSKIVFRIRELLKSKNSAATKMCSDLSLGVNFLYQFEKGRAASCVTLALIADYLDCSVDYLLGRTERKDSHKA